MAQFNDMSEACGGGTSDANNLGGPRGKVGERRDGKWFRKCPRKPGTRKDERASKRRRGF